MSRIIAAPGVVALLFIGSPMTDISAAILFGVAATTDYFDGYFARKYKDGSVYGTLMDPLADKFLVISALCMLQDIGRVSPIVVILLICRELAITGLRAVASSEGVIIAASKSAKWKTGTQMVAIPFMMVYPGIWGLPLFIVGKYLLWISLAISLTSAWNYMYSFFKKLRQIQSTRREKSIRKKSKARPQPASSN